MYRASSTAAWSWCFHEVAQCRETRSGSRRLRRTLANSHDMPYSHFSDVRRQEHHAMTDWTPRGVVFETGRSAHNEGLAPGAAAKLAGRWLGSGMRQGRSKEHHAM